MKEPQDIFNKIAELKKEQKAIKKTYKEALALFHEFAEITDEIKTLREKKKQIEEVIKEDFNKDMERLEDLKDDVASEQEMLSDVALNKLVRGESVTIKDEYENEYEPQFSVKFRKIG
jgi:predicted nuclease with TOPRIM domain